MDIRNLFIRLGVKVDKRQMSEAKKSINEFKSGMRILAKAATAAFVGVGAGMAFAVKKAADMEQLKIGFNTILKSGEKVQFLMEDLKKLTMETPFKFEDTAAGAKKLLALGVPVEKVTTKLRMLGDIAAGSSSNISSMIQAYRRVVAKGTAEQEALNIMTDRGIPIVKELGKTMGMTVKEVTKAIERRKVTYDIFEKTLLRMTSKGGMFFNAMVDQSKSLTGVWSIIMDNVSLLATEIGEGFLPQIKEVAKSILTWIQANKELIKTKITEYVQKFVWFLEAAWSGAKRLWKIVNTMVNLFGGWKTVMTTLAAIMAAFLVMQIISLTMAVMPILKIIALVGILKALWEDVYYEFAGGKDTFFGKMIELYPWVGKLKLALGGLGKLIASVVAAFAEDDPSVWANLMIDGFRDIGDAILSIFGTDGQQMADMITSWIPAAKEALKTFGEWVATFLSGGTLGVVAKWVYSKAFGDSDIKPANFSPTGMSGAAAGGGGNNTVSINMPMKFQSLPPELDGNQAMSYIGGVVKETLKEELGNARQSVKQTEEQ